jgi:hypothetical protein
MIMQDISVNKLIEEARIYYFNIDFVNCPAFNNRPVYFNRNGWNHCDDLTQKAPIKSLLKNLCQMQSKIVSEGPLFPQRLISCK